MKVLTANDARAQPRRVSEANEETACEAGGVRWSAWLGGIYFFACSVT